MSEDPPRVLLTNAEERSILAACRSLHTTGYAVSAIAFAPYAATHWSRACTERLRMADPGRDGERFVEDLRRGLTRRRYAVLVPGSDRALLAISRGRERLEGLTRLGLPSPASVERSLDREAMAEVAATVGFSPAESIRCTSLDEGRAAARALGLPLILKAPRTASQVDGAVQRTPPSRRVATEQELAEAQSAHPGVFLVQRVEAGLPLSFAGVMAGGRLLGVAVARYRRTWPVNAGNAAFAETIAAAPVLEDMVQALLAGLGWEGIFELELIQAGDRFVPIDLNPRPYGSMALAAAAGAPLAAIWCDWLLEHNPRPVRARPGYRYRCEDADLRHLLWQLRHGNPRAAFDAARPRRKVTHAYFRIADPLPLFIRGLSIAHARVARMGKSTIDSSPPLTESARESPPA
jgi:predicted ATP-grasp superfamily ATP-dependent carboligase